MIVYVILCNGWDIDREGYNDIRGIYRTEQSALKVLDHLTESVKSSGRSESYTLEQHTVED
jgi:hypothetical protein